ncbi:MULTISPECIES: 3-keto-L-gulonate-6-phosphate decarboxylase UlaD [Mycoplasmopsis]|uniref:3-hexulose-6-phosphate synthase n=4 Tax=Mycoplasmopsis synoviae TaxID=2109 RepID=Q4A720_MYCS5|nr:MULTISPECIES: 3-keto-L-gulonate-6-phosphate decarboxylase UlaD [Mycoplasmopsis]AAZ43451.1 3-hexulose-6- phosphate synthase [Mycoplasmopsis synoviae 53]AKJ20954.1 3-keto-L-gulonate 6-phosphate decarboxylase [Mycoplasmopsis synoviae]AQU48289.1 3-keto-L-gulonate 6-phosphate decarboxylase [Mycoplasmopsis synoviae]AWL83874.1 3-keto-L-gulonate-6-phosphate decarboxylase [Mycoplasmopsis synoviae]QGL45272.1 3-dehydro-L-gulonate-6-phosphate decarboxylase [Mycoplasmopsis synoviae]
MNKPLLQIALDFWEIQDAILAVKKAKKYIDVIEVGTILIASQGKKAIKALAEEFPDKIIVADGKIADAGKIFGKMFFENKARFTTCICAAEIPTIKDTMEIAKTFSPLNEVQMEMTNNFTWDQVQKWKEINVPQVVWHRSRDLQASGVKWNQNDIDSVKKLANMGFKVTVTGGVTKEDIKLFKGIPIYIFIAGRTIYGAENPELAAKELKDEINKYW